MTTMPKSLFAALEVSTTPDPVVLEYLKAGGMAKDAEQEAYLARLRRDVISKPVIYLGTGTCGMGAGAAKVGNVLRQYLEANHKDVEIVEVGCIGMCAFEPMLDVQMPGKRRLSFMQVSPDNVAAILDGVFAGKIPTANLVGQFRAGPAEAWADLPYLDEHPFFKPQLRWVLEFSGIIDPGSIEEYIARGGYKSFLETIRSKTREAVCDTVEKSGLRGRGGGGFPAGRKWKMALSQSSDQKYLICNADEGDPGAFMDRALIESDPHKLLEGMMIAAYAIGAKDAYVYIRAEYPLAVQRLREAIARATAYGLIGDHIMGSGFNLQFHIKMGAGAFVCGEETALMHSIEGRRGMPRPRPPYPAQSGLFAKPTVINNVETLANVPVVMRKGAEGYAAVGTATSKGTKIFALSGKVQRAGLVEVAMGTSLRTVIFDVGSGPPAGKKFKAVQIGGPSGGCIPPQLLDTPIDYETLKSAGAIMGSGGLVVLDETTCMVDFAKFFMEFIQSESCGKCIPCREGTRRMLEILDAITRPRRKEENIDALVRFQGIMRLAELAETIKITSLCGLGQTAPNPVLSTLRWFRDEYEAHVFERSCPAGACKDLVGAPCQNTCPVGTEAWRYVAHIARGEYAEAYRVIRSANPFPSACARVCDHPCELMCRAGATGGEPIAVRTLKRFVVDRVAPDTYKEPVKPAGANAPKIAVIGAGPSGLTAAHYLGAMGNRVTVFERESKPGGMLVSAIPEYRLPRETLRKEIDSLLNVNVELKLNQTLGKDFTIDSLMDKDGYKAVYVATGAHESKRLGLSGDDAVGVLPSIKFLKAYNLEGKHLAKGRVGIIGGGNSAIDAARVAFRQKGVTGVTVFYRRTRTEMPAYAEEIEAALAEGIVLKPLVAPIGVVVKDGKLGGVKFINNELGPLDDSGRQQPVPIPGSEHVVDLDTLIVAISEQPEAGGLAALKTTRWGTVTVNPESFTTSRPGVFAGGDVTSGPSTVIKAIAAGKSAAVMLQNFVSGKLLKQLPKVKLPSFYVEPVQVAGEEEEGDVMVARVKQPHLPVEKRRGSFAEVELCISEEAAQCEARRCLRCDLDFTRPLH
jgi:NADH-quinone oxidoreductase subunit F